MTDPFDPLDELASAHLDGATTPDEDRRIAGDPGLRARVDALGAVRDAVRDAAAPVDDERREHAIAAALAAFDEVRPGPAGVTSLAEVAARRSRTRQLRLVGAAAAVVLLAVLVPVLSRLGDDDPEEPLASRSADSADEQESAGTTTTLASPFGASGPAAEDATAGSSQDRELAAALAEPTHLGSFDDLRSLAAAATAILQGAPQPPADAGSTTVPDPAVDGCVARAFADGTTAAQVTFAGTAELDGRRVVVVVVDRIDQPHPERELIVQDPADGCRQVARTLLALPGQATPP